MPWGLDRVCKFIGFYALGVFANANCMRFKQGIQNLRLRLFKELYRAIIVTTGILLLILVFYLAQVSSQESAMWYVNAVLGVAGCSLVSMIVDSSVFQYLGRASIVVLCFHGPIYRAFVLVESIVLKVQTEIVRTNIVLVITAIIGTLLICSVIYQIVVKYFPWIVGRKNAAK